MSKQEQQNQRRVIVVYWQHITADGIVFEHREVWSEYSASALRGARQFADGFEPSQKAHVEVENV